MNSEAGFLWSDLIEVSRGEVVSHHRAFEQVHIDTDTRTLGANSFFLPLKGANFNGNAYIEKAYELGAQGAFIEASYLAEHPELKRFPNLIAVADPLETYLALGRFHRRRTGVQVVAITGSSGKTTVKEMLYALLDAAHPGEVQKSEKNFNNEVGVSQTLLSIRPETRYLVVEMGMRGLNQIALLTHYAEPDIAIVNNVGPAHIGLLGTMENIAKAKCEIFQGLDPKTGVGIINGDDPLLVKEASRYWGGMMETFTLHDVDEVHRLPDGTITFTLDEFTFTLGLPGTHNVLNALAGIRACKILNVPLKKITEALAQFEAGGARWHKMAVEGIPDYWIINDAYNANPSSMKMALETFIGISAPGLSKVAVIGEMGELGDHTEAYHRELGDWINSRGGLNGVIVLGEACRFMLEAIEPDNIPVYFAENKQDVASLMRTHWPEKALFLLKASRSCGLEEVPTLLTSEVQSPHGVS